jgi:hypothetical protein
MKKPIASLAAASSFLALTGCASIVHGPNQKILVETNPPGAIASALGKSVVTPGTLVMPRKTEEARIRIEKEGYETLVVPLVRKDSAALWLNMVALPAGIYAGGAIGYEKDKESHEWLAVENTIAGAAIGGVAVPFALMGTDMATGAAYKLVPSHVIVDLKPIAAPVAGLRQ